MGAVKGLWMDEYAAIGDEYPGIIDRVEAARRLKALGISEDEVEEQLDIMEEDEEDEDEEED